MPGEWDQEAERWIRWARASEFDAYWFYRDAFFDSLLPAPTGRTLEIGCGEGRVTRDLADRGHRVTAVDSAAALVQSARALDRSSTYLVGEGARVPLRAGQFALVVAYNALQVVDDIRGTVHECARLLRGGGHLCFCVAHPVTDMGVWLDRPPRLAVRPDYFANTRVEDTVEIGDLHMTFRGWTYSLEDYANALHDAGLVIELIREPIPTRGTRFQRWSQAPLFMNVRAVKRAS